MAVSRTVWLAPLLSVQAAMAVYTEASAATKRTVKACAAPGASTSLETGSTENGAGVFQLMDTGSAPVFVT